MMIFIRKYQRLFFSVIAGTVICSLLFWGTFSVLSDEEKPVDRVVGHAVDGSTVRMSEVKALSRFLASDRQDIIQGPHVLANLCNDGVIRHDLLESGLAHLLVADYWDPLEKELKTRLERVKAFRPYMHPQVSALSAQTIWERFLPSIPRDLSLLQQQTEVTEKTFALLVSLYQQQSYFSPETLRHFLQMQQRQYQIPFDLRLQQGDLSLFGFHSLKDWFGNHFIDLSAQFILNGACLAEQKGYRVSLEEAKGDLSLIFEESMKKLKDDFKGSLSFNDHLRSLGFDLNSAAKVWQKVLLFRRYFQGVSQATFMDRLPFMDFASYAKETAILDLYQWPKEMRLQSFNDLIEFQVYLSAIAPSLKDSLALPSSIVSQEEIELHFPELFPTLYRVKMSEVSLQQAALLAPMKDVLDWELDEKNWQKLQSSFSFIPSSSTKKERLQALEGLNSKNRLELDHFVRKTLLESHPEWIAASLSSVPLQEKTLAIAEHFSVLPHVEKKEPFASLLAAAAKGDGAAQKELLTYSDDGKVAYRIESVESLPRSILTFKQAKEMRIVSSLADRVLRNEYFKMRKASPEKFQDKAGHWKSFYDVKQVVAKHFFSSILKKISSIEQKEWTDADYAVYRLLFPARLAWEDLKKNGLDSQWLQKEGDPLVQQFKLEKREVEIQRTAHEEWMKNEAFIMVPKEWSSIQVPPTGDISFFYLSEKHLPETPILEQIFFGKEILSADAQRYIAARFLESLKSKKSIVIPLEEKENESF